MSDNSPLSRPTNASVPRSSDIAINCNEELSPDVMGYLRNGLAQNTRRAYAADLSHFETWGGTVPASEAMVAN